MPRSASKSVHKSTPRDHKKASTQLYKISHLINVKVKQSYFFCFCKIEQLAQKRVDNTPVNIEIPPIIRPKDEGIDSKTPTKL